MARDRKRKKLLSLKVNFSTSQARKEHISSKCLRFAFKKDKNVSICPVISKSWQ